MARALDGYRILDVEGTLPHNYCTHMLADLGADVIRVNPAIPRRGEGAMREEPVDGMNRNKKSLALDLKQQAGKKVFYKLAKSADALLDGMRPGTTKRLGIDYDTLKGINPRLVYCAISGFGQSGPYANWVGHDNNYSAVAGMLTLDGEEGGPPRWPGVPYVDMASGLTGAYAILAGLLAREKTGKGQFIDVSMMDVSLHLTSMHLGSYFTKGVTPTRGDVSPINGPWANIFKCKDGRYVSTANLEPWFWQRFCQEIGKPEWAEMTSGFGGRDSVAKRKELLRQLREVMKTKTAAEWVSQMADKSIAIAPVNENFDEVFNDPHVKARGLMIEVEHPRRGKVKQIRPLLVLSETPADVRSMPPRHGEHTDAILAELGYSQAEIDGLRKAGAINPILG